MSAINEKAVNGTQLQRTHKKIYRHLMPLLIVAYIISFIDRTNIGMAKATMSVDIGLSATAFGLGAGLFFLTYAVLEIPSNLFLTRIGARRWIARIMITWGILSCGMAFVTGPTSFYVMRLLLGAAEAGLYPGIIYYLTLWFGREERAKATGLFLLGVCLANIIGAPLGGLLLSLDGMSGWHGWQWMFFIEGLPAIALAFVVWRRLPDKPAERGTGERSRGNAPYAEPFLPENRAVHPSVFVAGADLLYPPVFGLRPELFPAGDHR